MGFLADNGYRVWPLSRVFAHLAEGKPIPEDTVALTFDDAYRSVYSEVFPRLKRRGWPFTVFVSTDYIDNGYGNYVSWDQLREMAAAGAEVANHSRSHPHLVRRRDDETRAQWLDRVRAEVTGAQERLEAEIDDPVRIFAYPYGEFSAPVVKVVEALGFFGVGQQSGAVGEPSDLAAAPRFPLASGYSDLDKFATKVRSRPLPVTVLAPEDRLLAAESGAPVLRLRLGPGPFRRDGLACYVTGQGRAELEWLDREKGVVAVQAGEALGPGRSKYNCTAPGTEGNGVFYWYSHLWMKPNPDGSWYAE
jgi:peptidoglycan/xylan/chitin deacetylase (PgdA/CDA1 family)